MSNGLAKNISSVTSADIYSSRMNSSRMNSSRMNSSRMNSSRMNSSRMNSSRMNSSRMNHSQQICSTLDESFMLRPRETFNHNPPVTEAFIPSRMVHQNLTPTSMRLGSAHHHPWGPYDDSNPDQPSPLRTQDVAICSNRSFSSTKRSFHSTTTFKDFDHIPRHPIHRINPTEWRSQSHIFPSHQPSSPNRLNHLNHEEEMDHLSQGRTPKVTFLASFLNKDDEPVPVKRFRDSEPSSFCTRCKKSNRVKRRRTQEENRTPFTDIISFHDVTSSVDDDVTDRTSSGCRRRSPTTMTTEVKIDHAGQSPDSTSKSYETRMSCPSAEAHVTSGSCSEPEVIDFRRKYWSQKMTRFPPRDRIFAEPHWTNTSCIVASYDLYCRHIKGLLIPLRREETSINQAGHEPRCGKEEEDAIPMTTEDDDKEEKEENREEEDKEEEKEEEKDKDAGGGAVDTVTPPGDDSSSALYEDEDEDVLRDQHKHLFTGFCLRCPGFSILDPSDQLTIIDHGQWSSFVFVSSRHWLPGQQNTIRRHLSRHLRTNSRSLVDLICQRLSRLSQRLDALSLDVIEEALLSSMLVIASDFPNLGQPKRIEHVRYKILTTFQAYITAKEGSSSDRLSRLLNSVPAIRQVAHELHALQRKTSMSSAVVQQRDEKIAVERESDRKNPLNPVAMFHASKLQGDKGNDDRRDAGKKEKEKKNGEVVGMEMERVQVERKVELMKEEEVVEEDRNGKEELEERANGELFGKRKTVMMEEEDGRMVENGKEKRLNAEEFKTRVRCSAKRSESQSSGVLLGSKLKADESVLYGADEKDCLLRLKAFNPIRKGFQQNMKRSDRDSEMLRRKLEHSTSTSDVLTEDFIDSILVSKVLAKRFNGSIPNSNVSSETFLGLIARIKG